MFARRIIPALTAGTTLTPFAVNQTGGGLVDLKITTSNGTPVMIDWGDGTTSTAASGVTASRTYATTYAGNVTVRSAGRLTWWESNNGKWSFDISSLPAGMTYFACGGLNTVTGNLSNLPAGVTYFACYGSNTIAGNLSSLPAVMTYFSCTGSNTITGNLSGLPAVMTSFVCIGSNTITGNLSSLPAVMTYFSCTGSNTITGNLSSLPAVMTYFSCTGSNTITGNLSGLPAVMTYFYCAGSNTITGNLSGLPAVMTSFVCIGSNTISDYVSRAWANNQSRFYFTPVSPGGLSSAEIDQLLIDLAAAGGTWGSPKEVYLKGTNAARTAASAAAVATLQGKGVAVTTN